jgi:hypothetical protein
MPVTAEITTDVKIAGLGVPCTFSVVQYLGFEAILGIDFLKEAHAVIDIKNNTLSLCDGLIAVPLVTAVDHVSVSTATVVKLPPFSETIFNAIADTKQRKGIHMTENSPFTCCKQLLVARTIFKPHKRICCCRVFNPTNSTIEIPPNSIVAMATPVDIVQQKKDQQRVKEENEISVSDMRRVHRLCYTTKSLTNT